MLASSSTLINHSRSLRIHEVLSIYLTFWRFSMFSNARQSPRLPVISYSFASPYIIDYINKQKFMYDLFIEMNNKKRSVRKKRSCEAHKVFKKFNKSNWYLPKSWAQGKIMERKKFVYFSKQDGRSKMQNNLKTHKYLMADCECCSAVFTWKL